MADLPFLAFWMAAALFIEAAMRWSLDMAYEATGLKRTMLYATAKGRPTYERMGYRAVAELVMYMLPH